MPRWCTAVTLALAAALALPATAGAKPTLQPLVDQVPLGSHFKDRLFTSSSRTARAATVTGKAFSYPTKDGGTVVATISDRYGNQLNTNVVQTYVDFLDSLEHGPELHTLKMFIAPAAQILEECGGQEGTLACYDSRTKSMFIPGEEPNTGSDGVTLSYVVAHEYGHHIAASRNNTPFRAFATGPKYWASYEMVCNHALSGRLAPGNEEQFYRSNPGEGWAETYAQLKYPEVSWQYDPIMKPDQAAFDVARRDVLAPWTRQTTKVFSGAFGRSGSRTRKFSFDLTLDGSLSMRLKGPRKAEYNFSISSNGRNEGRTSRVGSRDSVAYDAACRQDALERVTVTVKRISGSGPFTLRVSYAG
jgi:hypothetical protein